MAVNQSNYPRLLAIYSPLATRAVGQFLCVEKKLHHLVIKSCKMSGIDHSAQIFCRRKMGGKTRKILELILGRSNKIALDKLAEIRGNFGRMDSFVYHLIGTQIPRGIL